MAVMATYCQICGLPVQQDHYVPVPESGMWRIWRGDGNDDGAPGVALGSEHAWLRRAVGVRVDESLPEPIIEGEVQDGYLTGEGEVAWVVEGLGDRVAVHRVCWDLAGRPDSWSAVGYVGQAIDPEPYQQQLFDFEKCVDDGHGWMLVDPSADTPDGRRSRERILALLTP